MAVTPSTNLKLLSVPIAIDNMNQLTFTNPQSQYNYFNSLPYDELLDNITYQRYDSVIRYPGHIDTLRQYNYCMYQNENYDNKWFYAFIVGMEYSNDNVTLISIKTDVFQTWQFDLSWKKSFVEREHVNDDIAGKHTIPENVVTGEYITINEKIDNTLVDCGIVLGSTTSPIDGSEVTGVYNGIPQGVGYYGYYFDEIDILQENLQYLTNQGKQSGITGIFIAPKLLMNYIHGGQKISNLDIPREYQIELDVITNLNGYTPINKKLLTYPYCYTLVNNGNGGTSILQPQLWNNISSQNYKVVGVLTPSCSIIGFPQFYSGEYSQNNLFQLTAGKYPILNYSTDLFTNWQTENGLNKAISYLQGGLQIVGGVGKMLTGINAVEGADQFQGGFINIAQAIHSEQMADRIPPQVNGNINCGDVNFANQNITFSFHYRTIKREYAELIDNYFSMYGYKVSTLKIPNITGRQNWNYVQTIGANIIADIPQEDLEEIKNIFNKGVTLWHNPSTFLDYNQSNNIV